MRITLMVAEGTEQAKRRMTLKQKTNKKPPVKGGFLKQPGITHHISPQPGLQRR